MTPPEAIFEEIKSLTPSYAGMSYARLAANGLQWPCPTPEHPGTVFLHKDRFSRGKGAFTAIDYKPPAEVTTRTIPCGSPPVGPSRITTPAA